MAKPKLENWKGREVPTDLTSVNPVKPKLDTKQIDESESAS